MDTTQIGRAGELDKFSGFRVPPLGIGRRLLTVIDSLQEHIPLHAIDGPAGLMLGARRAR